MPGQRVKFYIVYPLVFDWLYVHKLKFKIMNERPVINVKVEKKQRRAVHSYFMKFFQQTNDGCVRISPMEILVFFLVFPRQPNLPPYSWPDSIKLLTTLMTKICGWRVFLTARTVKYFRKFVRIVTQAKKKVWQLPANPNTQSSILQCARILVMF